MKKTLKLFNKHLLQVPNILWTQRFLNFAHFPIQIDAHRAPHQKFLGIFFPNLISDLKICAFVLIHLLTPFPSPISFRLLHLKEILPGVSIDQFHIFFQFQFLVPLNIPRLPLTRAVPG
jgi:hypothetical protein